MEITELLWQTEWKYNNSSQNWSWYRYRCLEQDSNSRPPQADPFPSREAGSKHLLFFSKSTSGNTDQGTWNKEANTSNRHLKILKQQFNYEIWFLNVTTHRCKKCWKFYWTSKKHVSTPWPTIFVLQTLHQLYGLISYGIKYHFSKLSVFLCV